MSKESGLTDVKIIKSGKNTYVYDAHPYHTKVPPEGIQRIIQRFSSEDDLILDPFGGSGMTGIASRRSRRNSICIDLSPAATFISKTMQSPMDPKKYQLASERLISKVEDELGHLWQIKIDSVEGTVREKYTAWSYTYECPACSYSDALFYSAKKEERVQKKSKIKSKFECPGCGVLLNKQKLKKLEPERVRVYFPSQTRKRRNEWREPIQSDEMLHSEAEAYAAKNASEIIGLEIPVGVNTNQAINSGITHLGQLYYPRTLATYACFWKHLNELEDPTEKQWLTFTLTSLYKRITRLAEFRFWGGSSNKANYHIPWVGKELNVIEAFETKRDTISLYLSDESTNFPRNSNISNDSVTGSATNLEMLESGCVGYIFTDPPFGKNLNYSDMNFIWEGWLGEYTDTENEAIMNKIQNKGIEEYQGLLKSAFTECYRVLKEGGKMSVMFNNSKADVWGALKSAILESGFQIDDVEMFDKIHGTIKMFVSDNAVGYDLVIHCSRASGRKKHIPMPIEEFYDICSEEMSENMHHFLHVERDSEPDLRKFYSMRVAENMLSDAELPSFESFRENILKRLIREP